MVHKQCLIVDPVKIVVILDFPPPTSVKQLHETLDHRGYHRKFIKGYTHITTPTQKLLKKEANFQSSDDCQKGLDTLKHKLVIAPILIFPNWNKAFHVHVDASSVALGAIFS
jgi:hypothetical protein